MKDAAVIPIDKFIESGLGVCRHHAMVASYFLDRLTKEPQGAPLLEGVVQHMRDNVAQGGGHVWVTYLSKKEDRKRWHVDTLWKELADFSQPEGIERLQRLYGAEAIGNQILKTNGVVKQNLASPLQRIRLSSF